MGPGTKHAGAARECIDSFALRFGLTLLTRSHSREYLDPSSHQLPSVDACFGISSSRARRSGRCERNAVEPTLQKLRLNNIERDVQFTIFYRATDKLENPYDFIMHRLSEENVDRENKNEERRYFEEEGEIRKNYAPMGIYIWIKSRTIHIDVALQASKRYPTPDNCPLAECSRDDARCFCRSPGNSRDNCRFNPCCRFHRTMHAPPILVFDSCCAYTAPITIVRGGIWKTLSRGKPLIVIPSARPIGFRLIMTIRARMATLVWEKMSLIFH